jgi:anaerobic selenocysteine-containing dehydrogenase
MQIAVKGASDAAFALSMAQVMFAENIADWTFLKEQTDFSLLVRKDTRRYLRQTDVDGQGREDQLYQWIHGTGLRQANRGDLRLNGSHVALEGEPR